MHAFTPRETVIEIVNKLFIYTDERHWEKLQREVFAEEVMFDMTSLGGERSLMKAKAICETWEQGFTGIDTVNHLAGNYLVTFEGDQASVFCYATATHFKEATQNGKTREFTGTYDLHLTRLADGWRIDAFTYTLKYANGNLDLS